MITARQYGAMMRQQGVLWPAPAIGTADIKQPEVSIYQIGGRSVSNTFVLVRKKWATVYVNPAYTGYRAAFDDVMPRTSDGQDVDHLLPRSKGVGADFLALGRIGGTSNRGWNDDESHQAMAQKVRNMPTASPHSFTSFLTDMERGWAVVTCYIRPFRELNQTILSKVDTKNI
ncbi:hypothetical protein [Litoreibacter arenae]|uniref:Uncharacterized protein n=1 Tax=Litoreibacter arenae DSM 19593 TaxID=1123360 RepID=S9RRZ4_9RHOB|nr:hypothetical protein [Litoreibacter arenae]EPX80830.1 hypothetical protein thalar_01052 [Litoreibacter arenae DSM 19593]